MAYAKIFTLYTRSNTSDLVFADGLIVDNIPGTPPILSGCPLTFTQLILSTGSSTEQYNLGLREGRLTPYSKTCHSLAELYIL